MKVCPVCGKEYADTTTLCSVDAAVLRSVDDPLLGQTLAEKYLIEKLVKRGGMGAVYRGKHVLMDKTVAIKVLRPSLAVDDAVVARFSREAKAASRISHPHAVNITAPNLVVGTPQYMSPEQCSQTGSIDARSDIYSLGVIVYEMLAGQVPFTGESPTVIMMKQVQDRPPSILATRADLPAAIDQAIAKALAKQPADRFQTAGEFSAELSRASEAGVALADAPMPVADTVPNAPVPPDDLDEITLIHTRQEATSVRSRQEIPIPAQEVGVRPGPATVNPWRIMIPAAIVMVVVFGAVFLLTRGTAPTTSNQTNGQQTGLTADPNSQPVQALSPPTGESERGIQAQTLTSTSSTPLGVKETANENPNQ